MKYLLLSADTTQCPVPASSQKISLRLKRRETRESLYLYTENTRQLGLKTRTKKFFTSYINVNPNFFCFRKWISYNNSTTLININHVETLLTSHISRNLLSSLSSLHSNHLQSSSDQHHRAWRKEFPDIFLLSEFGVIIQNRNLVLTDSFTITSHETWTHYFSIKALTALPLWFIFLVWIIMRSWTVFKTSNVKHQQSKEFKICLIWIWYSLSLFLLQNV